MFVENLILDDFTDDDFKDKEIMYYVIMTSLHIR